jgi:hypothetical protein
MDIVRLPLWWWCSPSCSGQPAQTWKGEEPFTKSQVADRPRSVRRGCHDAASPCPPARSPVFSAKNGPPIAASAGAPALAGRQPFARHKREAASKTRRRRVVAASALSTSWLGNSQAVNNVQRCHHCQWRPRYDEGLLIRGSHDAPCAPSPGPPRCIYQRQNLPFPPSSGSLFELCFAYNAFFFFWYVSI